MASMKKTRTEGIWRRRNHFYMRKREAGAEWQRVG